MRPFSFSCFSPGNEIPDLVRDKNPGSAFLGGGTNLVDLMKKGIAQPERLIAISKSLPHDIQSDASGIIIGAAATNSVTASHAEVKHRFPLLSNAILAGASPQIRNMATAAGNLMQRTRCPYFYNTTLPCNKRKPGSGCGALHSEEQRMNAIIGWSETCVAVHPSDMCVALAALDAEVITEGRSGEQKTIPFADFHRLPGSDATRDTNLPQDHIITAIRVPQNAFSHHSAYVKIRDRTSYAFALVSVAAALEMDGEMIVQARLASGGVAHKPWRWTAAEDFLRGKKATEKTLESAIALALAETKPLAHNGFKKDLLRGALWAALSPTPALPEGEGDRK